MDEWITDRLPTANDADEDGDVEIPCHCKCETPGLESRLTNWIHFSQVPPNQAWWSKKAALKAATLEISEAEQEASANPAPAPEHADPVEQAQLDRYRAKTALIEARTTLVLAQAKAIAFPSESPHPDQDRVRFFFPPLACSLFR
jgi:hypothetical protein